MAMTDEEFQTLMMEALDQISNRQGATARSVRLLAEGLTISETRKKSEDDRIARLEGAVAALVPQDKNSDDISPIHHHRRKDDSIQFKVDKDGDARLLSNIKLKTLAGWGVAVLLGVVHVIRLIVDVVHHH